MNFSGYDVAPELPRTGICNLGRLVSVVVLSSRVFPTVPQIDALTITRVSAPDKNTVCTYNIPTLALTTTAPIN